MIHPDTEIRFINEKIGYGVVATKLIPKGTITWALDKLDRTFTPEYINNLEPVYRQIMDKYTYRNPQGHYVLCWDIARFINHSANANCITTAYDFEIAIRDIQPGEELTDDYGYLNVEEPFEVVPEPGSNRTVVYPDDLVRYYAIWDEKLLGAFPNLLHVEQPLFQILEKSTQEKARLIAQGQVKMDSILNCYYRNGSHNGKNGKEKPELTVRSPQVIYPY